jgi:hypothetical protein
MRTTATRHRPLATWLALAISSTHRTRQPSLCGPGDARAQWRYTRWTLVRSRFERNILTFNPGWDANALVDQHV